MMVTVREGEASTTHNGRPRLQAPFADNPTNGLVPLSVTEIFLQRLAGWAQLVKRLILQFELIVDHQRRLADVYGRCAREFIIPIITKDGANVFGNDESSMSVFGGMQKAHVKLQNENAEFASMLETHVLPKLRSLLADLRRKAADTDKEWISLDRELARDRDVYVKLTEQLKAALDTHSGLAVDDSSTEVVSMTDKDPWTANLAVRCHVATCLYKQEHYHSSILSQQNHFATFECTIIQTLRVSLSTFFDWQTKDLTSSLDMFRKLKNSLHELDPVKDWTSFRQRHNDRILSLTAPKLVSENIWYEGQKDALVTSHKEGLLYRKDGGMRLGFKRSWKETWVLVSSAGYLHAFPPNVRPNSIRQGGDEERENLEPELSLYLPDCVIGPMMANEKEPEEFVVQEKSTGLFGGEKKHKFKGADLNESVQWWGYLSERVRTTVNRNDPLISKPSRRSMEQRKSRNSVSSVGSNPTVNDPLGAAPLAAVREVTEKEKRKPADPLGVGVVKAAARKPVSVGAVAESHAISVAASTPAARLTQAPQAADEFGDFESSPSHLHDAAGKSSAPPPHLSPVSIQPTSPQNLEYASPSLSSPYVAHSELEPDEVEPPKINIDPSLSMAENMDRALSSYPDMDAKSPVPDGDDPWGSPWGGEDNGLGGFDNVSSGLGGSLQRAARLGDFDEIGGGAWQ
ncbi:hypothetical protein HDU85_003446 [Gaertneriomyces sp. JEL0708]|nr:hypothetical protein HDU85_003446 [Gaertneriomyces sp. JEL0708]